MSAHRADSWAIGLFIGVAAVMWLKYANAEAHGWERALFFISAIFAAKSGITHRESP